MRPHEQYLRTVLDDVQALDKHCQLSVSWIKDKCLPFIEDELKRMDNNDNTTQDHLFINEGYNRFELLILLI